MVQVDEELDDDVPDEALKPSPKKKAKIEKPDAE